MEEKTDKIRITIEFPNGEKKLEECDRYILGLITDEPVSECCPNGEKMKVIRSGGHEYPEYCRYLTTMAAAIYSMHFESLVGIKEE